jgi:2-polyprenyl-6-methoxyphenol hydroxylase-like FAD-dependent oxidoreductase
MADDNLCVMGDAAVSGSPVGGYGASLAMSAWPKAVADYGKKVLAKLEKDDHTAELAKKAYNDQAEQIVRVRIGRPAMIMQHLGGYTLSARRAITSELLLPFK